MYDPLNYDTLTIPEATRLQQTLREQLLIQERDFPVNIIGGADISFNKFSTTVYAGIVLLSFPALQPVGYSLVKKKCYSHMCPATWPSGRYLLCWKPGSSCP